jgi:tripartite-type tricarboxylate transporter receptor subunit TctC
MKAFPRIFPRPAVVKRLAATVILSAMTIGSALAAYPEKPVTVIIPLGAGGSHDLNARVISSVLPTYLGQPVIVQLMPGSGGATGTSAAAAAAADGYTLLFTHNFIDQLQQHVTKLPYNTTKDFVTVVRTNSAAPSIIVRKDSKWQSFADMVAWGKQNPGKLRFGHSGNWGAFMVPGAMLLSDAGVKATLVPHKGGGPALQALLAGDIDVTMALPSVIDSQGDAIRVLASVSATTLTKGVPTTVELGFKGIDQVGTMNRVMLAPRGVPADVLAKLRSAFVKLNDDKTYMTLMKKLGEGTDMIDGESYEKIRANQSVKYKALVDQLKGGK